MQRTRNRLVAAIVGLLLVAGLAAPLAARAQDATPAGIGQAITSKTCAEFEAEQQAAFADTDEPAANTEGTYIVGATSDLQSVNPFLAASDPALDVVGLVFEGLFTTDPRNGQPAPCGLSDSWEIAPDGVTYTFHLSKAATWHDGVDFTAADVIFSFEALADPATASTYTGVFVDTVASWRAIDDDTVELVAKEPRVTVIYDLAGLWIVPKHVWEGVPHDQWAVDPGATGQDPSRVVGTGPFTFGEWTQAQEVRLIRNDAYHRPNQMKRYKEHVIRIFPDSQSQFNAFLNNEIDAIDDLSPDEVATVDASADQGLRSVVWPERGFIYYGFNLNPDHTTLFQDVRVRQAFMWAIDRQSIVDNILLGYGEVATGTQPSISPAYAPDAITTRYTYDPEKAKALLAEAGWTDTNGDGAVDKDGQEMRFDLQYSSDTATNDAVVAYLQDAWSQVGIAMQPQSLELNALIDVLTVSLDWQMALIGFFWDPTFIQEAMFACNQYLVGFNDQKYCNPALDEIFLATKREFDPELRRQLLIQAANVVNEEQPIGILYFDVGIAAYNARVHNYRMGAWGNQSWVGYWVDE